MKKLTALMVLTLLVSVCAMPALHWKDNRDLKPRLVAVERLHERGAVADRLVLELEKYRRTSATFRKLSAAEESEAKAHLKAEVLGGISKLDSLDPTPAEHAAGARLADQLAEFFVLSAKLEPMLFLKDVFLKPEAKTLHASMMKEAVGLAQSGRERASTMEAEILAGQDRTLPMMLVAAATIVAALFLILMKNFLTFARPIARLRERAREIAEEQGETSTPANHKPLRGVYGEIERILRELSDTVAAQRKERHQFITAVASDLRTPLVTLQAGSEILARGDDRIDPAQKLQAAEVVRRAVARLSRSLEDLTDIVDTDRREIRLDEKIVDLRESLGDACRLMSGGSGVGALHDVSCTVPQFPVWTLLDAPRFERVMINLVSKLMQLQPQGGRIHVAMNRPQHGNFRGVEIQIMDAERLRAGAAAPAQPGTVRGSGPEQDLLRHWVSENGFGMSLAQRIMESHGGSITASGVAGTGVVFTIRIPQERVTVGRDVMSRLGEPSRDSRLEAPRVQAMFAKQAIHFGA